MARAAAGEAQARKIAQGGPYVFLQGGPYHGAYYTEADWQVTRDAEQWGIEQAGEQRPKVMGLYEQTKAFESCSDPKLPGLTGRVWRWTGKVEPMNRAGRRLR